MLFQHGARPEHIHVAVLPVRNGPQDRPFCPKAACRGSNPLIAGRTEDAGAALGRARWGDRVSAQWLPRHQHHVLARDPLRTATGGNQGEYVPVHRPATAPSSLTRETSRTGCTEWLCKLCTHLRRCPTATYGCCSGTRHAHCRSLLTARRTR